MPGSMPESMRLLLERAEDQQLSPLAERSAGASRRHPLEDEGRAFDYRTHFQRDRDRIVYSRAFRRLHQKAPADSLSNRLTHTLEVAQLARTIGRALRLNEDLIEAIALGHDLGQPPFGAAGERALDDLLSGRLDGKGGAGLGSLGGFARSVQSLRVVDELERRYAGHPGLNLTDPTREGIFKSGPAGRRRGGGEGLRGALAPPFEVQSVALADRLAAALHELDDALQAGTLELAQVERLAAVRALREKLGSGYRQRTSRFMKANAIHRGLIHLLVTGAILASGRVLARWAERHRVASAADYRRVRDGALEGD
ncbi:MAG TPA: HD domain-containing protein, partial [Candidatus Polarisedimenticolaceae bacterium]|nr:HD domain-containing protein [Candidatus Polarisedimenticolaceae bacterium]